jgi:hypothetical protein
MGAASAGASTTSTAQAHGSREVLWDGDVVARGQGWANCDKPAEGCKATLTPTPSVGAGGTSGLKLQAQGSGWQGGGWNWFGWWPENAGTDVSGYHELILALKITGAAPDKTPKAEAVSFALGCSVAKKSSLAVPLSKYASNAMDGQWHDVAIPLQDFFGGKGAECDARAVWELQVSVWSEAPVQFDLVLDNVALARR